VNKCGKYVIADHNVIIFAAKSALIASTYFIAGCVTEFACFSGSKHL